MGYKCEKMREVMTERMRGGSGEVYPTYSRLEKMNVLLISYPTAMMSFTFSRKKCRVISGVKFFHKNFSSSVICNII